MDRDHEQSWCAVRADLYAGGNLQRPTSTASRHRADGGVGNVRPDDDYRPSVSLKSDPEPPGERCARMWRRYGRHPEGDGLRSGDDCGAESASSHLAGSDIQVMLPCECGESGT